MARFLFDYNVQRLLPYPGSLKCLIISSSLFTGLSESFILMIDSGAGKAKENWVCEALRLLCF
jgi:hypothetical protein